MSQLAEVIQQSNELTDKTNAFTSTLNDIAATKQNLQPTSGIDPLIFMAIIFTLACLVGYYTVWKVNAALYTPLISTTNAITGIIIIYVLIASNSVSSSASWLLGFIATFLTSINICIKGFIWNRSILGRVKRDLHSIIGMAITMIASFNITSSWYLPSLLIAAILGGAIGIYIFVKKAPMTPRLQLIAGFYSCVMLATVLVGFITALTPENYKIGTMACII